MFSLRVVAFFALGVACATTTGGVPTPPDATVDAPESAPDVTPANAPEVTLARDVTVDLTVTPREGDPCASVIDLRSRGVMQDGVVTFVADGAAAPERSTRSTPLCGTSRLALSFVTAFRYTARATSVVYFEVLDQNEGQPLRLDVLLADGCESDARAFTCLRATPEGSPLAAQTDAPVAAGSSVYLLVGTRLPVPAHLDVAGRFAVRVRELPSRAVGEPCADGEVSCVAGAACEARQLGRCVAAGALHAPCLPGRRCDEGLACDSGHCRRALALGDRCGAEQPLGSCPTETPCESNGTEYRCLADGTRGARCGTGAPRCDPGLSCVGSRCLEGVSEGARCFSGRPCAEGLSCAAPTGAFEGVCAREGSRGAGCRASAPACDDGLACTNDGTNRCLPAVALGAACDNYNQVSACAEGTCLSSYCRADGALGGLCRASSTPCDPGLRCNGSPLRCLPGVLAEASCDNRVCPPGATCVSSGAINGRCVNDGADGGRCRRRAPACDRGLACGRSTTSLAAPRCRPAARVGAACDANGRVSACEEGATCSRDGVCRRPGEVGGLCRETASLCEEGLRCVGRVPTYPGECMRVLARGASCGLYPDLCPTGQTCVDPQRPVCVDDGTARDARCRASAPACDPGLVCAQTTGRCVGEARVGDVCDPSEGYWQCVAGASCVSRTGITGGACARDGLAGARCRPSGTPCDPGLRCTGAPLAQNARCM